jgi:hypothetical protein
MVQRRRILFWDLFVADAWQVRPYYRIETPRIEFLYYLFRVSTLADHLPFLLHTLTAASLRTQTKSKTHKVKQNQDVGRFAHVYCLLSD